MINNVTLTGRLVRDPEFRNEVARAAIAVNRPYKNKNGEIEADFITLIAFGKTASVLVDYFQKGSLIGIEGRLQTGSYNNKDGHTVYTTSVLINRIIFLESRSNGNQVNQSGNNRSRSSRSNGYRNRNGGSSRRANFNDVRDDPFFDDGQPIDISDVDLPF